MGIVDLMLKSVRECLSEERKHTVAAEAAGAVNSNPRLTRKPWMSPKRPESQRRTMGMLSSGKIANRGV